MLSHLVVPLDGSRGAESSLAVATPIAKRTGALITLLHALDPGMDAASGLSTLAHERKVQEYLVEVKGWLTARGVRVAGLVREATPSAAATIVSVATELGADLMVLSSRGHGQASGIELGRLAREVLVSGSVPFLLVRPYREGRDYQFVCHRVLVPLDGSERAEAALPMAHMLAETFRGEMLLLWVLPARTVPRMETAAAPASRVVEAPRDEERFAQRYLDATAEGLRWGEITANTLVAHGNSLRTILETAEVQGVDMIVLATHGRTGNPTVWAGSVASRLVDWSERPVLLVRSVR